MISHRKFACVKCGADIAVTILNPGDRTKCIDCGHEQIVPDSVEGIEVAGRSLPGAAKMVQDGPRLELEAREVAEGLDRYDIVARALVLIAWAVPGYILPLSLNVGPSEWQLGGIADIMVLVAMDRLRQQGLWGFMPILAMIFAGLQLTSRISAFFGQADVYSVEVSSLILLAILLTLLKMTHRINGIRKYRSAIMAAIVTTVLTFLFLFGALFAIGALVVVHNFLVQFTPAAWLAQILGALVPVAACWLASVVLTLWVTIGIVRTVRSRVEPIGQ